MTEEEVDFIDIIRAKVRGDMFDPIGVLTALGIERGMNIKILRRVVGTMRGLRHHGDKEWGVLLLRMMIFDKV